MSKTANLSNLFQSSHDDGNLSADSLKALTLPDLGARIQQGLGISVDDVPSSEVFLLTMLIDDSASIRQGGNEGLVIEGYNTILAALKESKQESGILIHTRYLNGTVLCPYAPLHQAERLSPQNYRATGSTPLYDESVALLGTVVAKSQEFSDSGVPARGVAVIISDGADCGSQKYRAADVRHIVEDMVRGESHIVAAVGLDDRTTDFRRIFREMGIEDRWILTPGSDKSDIRAAFRVISQTAVRTSRTRGSLSKASIGGFGATP